MMRGLLLLWFLAVGYDCTAQQPTTPYRPLSTYDFTEGNFSLVFLPYGSTKSDSLYYLDDTPGLNLLKEKWVFEKEAVQYPFACNDGYTALLFKDKRAIDHFAIRIRCQAFVHGKEWWHMNAFSPILLSAKSAILADTSFTDLVQAREAYALFRQREDIGLVQMPDWLVNEGYFYFSYPNPNVKGKAPFTPWEEITEKINLLLAEEYPKDSMEIELISYGYGENYPNLTYRVSGTYSFFLAFDAYPKTQSGWNTYPLSFQYFIK